jgi:hypothetical protein
MEFPSLRLETLDYGPAAPTTLFKRYISRIWRGATRAFFKIYIPHLEGGYSFFLKDIYPVFGGGCSRFLEETPRVRRGILALFRRDAPDAEGDTRAF